MATATLLSMMNSLQPRNTDALLYFSQLPNYAGGTWNGMTLGPLTAAPNPFASRSSGSPPSSWDVSPEGMAALNLLGPPGYYKFDWWDLAGVGVWYAQVSGSGQVIWFPPTAQRGPTGDTSIMYAALTITYAPGDKPILGPPLSSSGTLPYPNGSVLVDPNTTGGSPGVVDGTPGNPVSWLIQNGQRCEIDGNAAAMAVLGYVPQAPGVAQPPGTGSGPAYVVVTTAVLDEYPIGPVLQAPPYTGTGSYSGTSTPLWDTGGPTLNSGDSMDSLLPLLLLSGGMGGSSGKKRKKKVEYVQAPEPTPYTGQGSYSPQGPAQTAPQGATS
jgi:hypothetical protein